MGAATLAPIVHALGGELGADGRRANVPGPGHSRADRSVSLVLVGRRVVAHSFAGDDWRVVLDDLRHRGLIDAAGELVGAPGAAALASDRPGPCRAQRVAAARTLWGEAGPLAGTLSAAHLAARAVSATAGADLRHHPAVAAAVYAGRGPRRPALLAGIRAAGGELVGVELTYLAADGARARVRTPRKTVGLRPPGSAVRLAPPGPHLLVGEGVFSCLAAAAVFRRPAWALLATGNLRAWRPPAGVRSVLIAADRGRDGERSARLLARRLRGAGVACAVQWPPPPHADWNDAAVAAREAEEGRVGAGAADGWSGPPAPESSPMPDPAEYVLLPDDLRAVLRANGAADPDPDRRPVLKLFNPAGAGTWLITEMMADGDTLFGLCDLDMGCPELGYVSLSEITSVELPFGLSIERDIGFEGRIPLSRWAEIARRAGSIREAEAVVRAMAPAAGAGPA